MIKPGAGSFRRPRLRSVNPIDRTFIRPSDNGPT